MKAKHTGPVATVAVFALVGGAIAASEGYIDPTPILDAVGVVAAYGSLGLTGLQSAALLIGTAFVAGGTHSAYKGLPAFPRAVTVLLRNPDAEAGKLHQTSGAVELAGTAEVLESAGTTTSPYTGTECLSYVYEKQEEQRQAGSSAGRSRRTWVTVEEGKEGYPFLLVDETGEVPVTAQEATVTLDFTESIEEPGGKMKEGVLEPGDDVYVHGHVRDGTAGDPQAPPDASTYVGAPRDGDGAFIVSDASETWTGLRFAAKAVVLTVLGVGLAAAGIVLMVYTGSLQQVAAALL